MNVQALVSTPNMTAVSPEEYKAFTAGEYKALYVFSPVSHITISPTSSYLAHPISDNTTPSHAHTLDASSHGGHLIVY